MGWKLHPKAIRPLGSEPATSYVNILAGRLNDIEAEIEILKARRDWLFAEAGVHGYDKRTVRNQAALLRNDRPAQKG